MLSRQISTYSAIIFVITLMNFPLNVSAKRSNKLQKTIAPPNADWIQLSENVKKKITSKELTEKDLQDSKALLEYLGTHPEKLNVAQMTPSIAFQVIQLLLFGGKPLMAIDLAQKSLKKWPDNIEIISMWARASVKVGLFSYTKPVLLKTLSRLPDSSYIRYLYASILFLESPDDKQQLALVHQQLTELLRRNPTYVGPDNVTAQQIQAFMQQIQEKLTSTQ